MKKEEAEKLLQKAWDERIIDDEKIKNWIKHSYNVAYVAETIGELSGLDPEKCYVMGLLHDFGRGQDKKIRHTILGYKSLKQNGVSEEVARIAITHLYILQDGSNLKNQYIDFQNDEQRFVENYLKNIEYDDYDKLIQLSDLIGGIKIQTIEERMFSVFCRYNITNTMQLCTQIKNLKEYFENKIRSSIYEPFKDSFAKKD